jgi:N-acyl-D-aspartate/D-glutamate deacylase
MRNLIIRNRDGTGRVTFSANLKRRIVEAGPEFDMEARTGRKEIDAASLLVTPGWIHVHSGVAIIKFGETTFAQGADTEARPGRLLCDAR